MERSSLYMYIGMQVQSKSVVVSYPPAHPRGEGRLVTMETFLGPMT